MRAGYARAYAKYQARVAPATSRSLSNSSRETGRPLEKTSEYGNGRGLVPSQARPERPPGHPGRQLRSGALPTLRVATPHHLVLGHPDGER